MTAWPPIYAGEDVTIRVPNIREAESGDLLNLDDATAIEWQLRRRLRSPGEDDDDDANPVILSKDLDDGITVDDSDVLVAIEPADTAELKGTYYADLWVTIANKRRLVRTPAAQVILQAVNAP